MCMNVYMLAGNADARAGRCGKRAGMYGLFIGTPFLLFNYGLKSLINIVYKI